MRLRSGMPLRATWLRAKSLYAFSNSFTFASSDWSHFAMASASEEEFSFAKNLNNNELSIFICLCFMWLTIVYTNESPDLSVNS